jgi:hypothetical protein
MDVGNRPLLFEMIPDPPIEYAYPLVELPVELNPPVDWIAFPDVLLDQTIPDVDTFPM